MDFDRNRLRRGELIVGIGGVVLLASMFLLKWYGLKAAIAPTAARLGVATSLNGWHGLVHVRWLVMVTTAAALALVFLQATRRAPAVPASMSVIVTVLGFLTALALAYRVLINVPGADTLEQKAGAFIGLLSAIVLSYGGYLSIREEGILPKDGPGEIETVRLPGAGRP